MKKTVLLFLLALFGTSAYSGSSYESSQVHCKAVESLAYTAQTYRQMGTKASAVTEELMPVIYTNDKKTREYQGKIIFKIVQDAYAVPVYETKSMQDKAISDFRERQYLKCMESQLAL